MPGTILQITRNHCAHLSCFEDCGMPAWPIGCVGSIGFGAEDKIKTRGLGERPEVAISREERNTLVNAALGNQRVAQASPAALCKDFRAQHSCPLPVAGYDFHQRNL